MAKEKFKNVAIGVDVGGSGIKGAPVDVKTGELVDERYRVDTPENAKPKDLAKVIRDVVDHFDLPKDLPIGVSFPAPIVRGVAPFMANLHPDWAGTNVVELLSKKVGRPVVVLNDADAAGYAEVHFGAAKGEKGTVMMLTLGTGIGSAVVVDGVLLPNTELGHLVLPNGKEAEEIAASSVRTAENLDFPEWAERLAVVFEYYEKIFSPDLFIIGGGVSKKHERFVPLLKTNAPIIPAELFNNAGIVGAALAAVERAPKKEKQDKKK